MGLFVNPDQSAFQSALNAQIYVDKSGLIEYTNSVLESTDAFICNSRPRRFGKSITADMLTAYYSRGCDSRDMFSSLKISQTPDWEKHLNKYDVIQFVRRASLVGTLDHVVADGDDLENAKDIFLKNGFVLVFLILFL